MPRRSSWRSRRSTCSGCRPPLRPGERDDERIGDEYREVWERARSLAGEEAAEGLFLTLLTHTHVLLAYLVASTGPSEAEWLDRMRADYVDRIPSSGSGVWGPRELRLG